MERCHTCGGQLTTGGCLRCPTYTIVGPWPPATAAPMLPFPTTQPSIDVPSMMFGKGFEQGCAFERARIRAGLIEAARKRGEMLDLAALDIIDGKCTPQGKDK